MTGLSEKATQGLVDLLRRSRIVRGVHSSDIEDFLQDVMLRWWVVVSRSPVMGLEDARKLTFAIARRCQCELRRKLARLAREALEDMGQIEDPKRGIQMREAAETEPAATILSYVGRGLSLMDAQVLVRVRIEGQTWREAIRAGGMEDREIQAARKRIERFLSYSWVQESCTRLLGHSTK